MDKSNSYNQIAKATGIFGGVQVFITGSDKLIAFRRHNGRFHA